MEPLQGGACDAALAPPSPVKDPHDVASSQLVRQSLDRVDTADLVLLV